MPIPASSESLELKAVNQILSAIGQAPVTDLNQTNPDVAIVYGILLEVNTDVQSEGWTFNKEYKVPTYPDVNDEIPWGENVLQMNISQDRSNWEKGNVRTIKKGGKVYDRQNHTYKFTKDMYYFDYMYQREWEDLPIPIRDYIVAKAASISSSRIVGDAQQYQMLQQQEAYCRAYALEYECNQGSYSIFGDPVGGTNYESYQPYIALRRY